MSQIVYEIVEHDGGWAYKLNGVFSETFPTRAAARISGGYIRPACGTETTTGPMAEGRSTAMAVDGGARESMDHGWQKKRDESSVAKSIC